MTHCTGCDERDEKIRQLERELYGKEYVPPIELRLTDRKPPEQPAPKPYAWTQDQIFPRKRA
jgi:hypothetical protein